MAVVRSILNVIIDKAVEECRDKDAENEKDAKDKKQGDKIPTEEMNKISCGRIFRGVNPTLGIEKRRIVTPRRRRLTTSEKEMKKKRKRPEYKQDIPGEMMQERRSRGFNPRN